MSDLTHYGRKSLTTQFDIFISSAKEGVKKPNQEIYIRTCEKLGVKPEECLFMDDNTQNIHAATALGMQTIWWETQKKGYGDFIKLKL